ncbi:hypothetical protein MNQ98_17475 [Paenibacillus sp. N3/727]|uniref:hypothetical protein n=1 Tax=Paenibacillus sp. N3/727 TaxID=2925845 RepID=UPI001F533B4F|nr:hypothetical protein [Paenibacillus sp. N3/727]UNK16309.1 hypothetical protein MNQ98_17475 [Paenibacillus sp. N3/727]
MKQEDIVIYACVIIGAGIGLMLGSAFPGVLVGLGIGYLIKFSFKKRINVALLFISRKKA